MPKLYEMYVCSYVRLRDVGNEHSAGGHMVDSLGILFGSKEIVTCEKDCIKIFDFLPRLN